MNVITTATLHWVTLGLFCTSYAGDVTGAVNLNGAEKRLVELTAEFQVDHWEAWFFFDRIRRYPGNAQDSSPKTEISSAVWSEPTLG